ncbi:MAG: pilus assembly protein PilP [Desulfobacterales bacterium]|nr:pilus assembly protein PilP [Desulfobacterales bacterium]
MTMAVGARNLLLGLILMLVASAGCGDHTESEPSRQQAVLRKKVVAPKEPASHVVKPRGSAAVKSKTAKVAATSGQAAQTPEEKATGKISDTKDVKKPILSETEPEAATAGKERLALPDESGGEALGEPVAEKVAYFYDRTGKPDPFKSPFAIGPDRVSPADKKPKKKRAPLTPLQRIDLSQLKLVGIVISPTGDKALVEGPSGKGYIISKGTYVGTNFGRVKRILRDRIIVEEEVEDFLSGEMKIQTTELRLKTKVGDV